MRVEGASHFQFLTSATEDGKARINSENSSSDSLFVWKSISLGTLTKYIFHNRYLSIAGEGPL